ncbi:hypothetical protein F2Q70_00007492 [Brassica cretica]|uniref:Uncharacterized protein n=1 Tax=Brassica cretica TaxID=69181 RepID=A0A8S9MB71_BRACR|nr:hypothetical protein F2Q70_00007492 [Brassica cretica]
MVDIVGVPAPGLQHQSTPRAADPKDKRKSKPTTQWVRTEGPRRNENEVFPSRHIPPRAVKQSTAKASDPNHSGKLIVELCASLFVWRMFQKTYLFCKMLECIATENCFGSKQVKTFETRRLKSMFVKSYPTASKLRS